MSNIPDVGKRYEFLWPRSRPSMRLVGNVTKIETVDMYSSAVVDFGAEKPHKVLLDDCRVREVGPEEPFAFQIRMKRRGGGA